MIAFAAKRLPATAGAVQEPVTDALVSALSSNDESDHQGRVSAGTVPWHRRCDRIHAIAITTRNRVPLTFAYAVA